MDVYRRTYAAGEERQAQGDSPTGNTRSAIYTVRVEDDENTPQFYSGDIVLADPNRPVTPGCIVVLRRRLTTGTGRVLIRLLVCMTADKIVTRLQASQAEVTYSTAHYDIHKVLSIAEMMGM